MIKLRDILFESDVDYSYRGEHKAPSKKSDDAPLYSVTSSMYPEDIYSTNAVRFYGDNWAFDGESIMIIQSARDKPQKPIKIYRAVPKISSRDEQIEEIESLKREYLRRGRIPTNSDYRGDPKKYYDYLNDKLEKLKSEPNTTSTVEKITINSGDWVTINRRYAVQHGKSNLNGKYKILTKTVPAKHLYTDGNSIHEWGYDPT